MADYNVQMKQYNGTSFDNILPYASQALTLAGGGGATEIIAQARAGLSQIATGSYVGNGMYGRSNPVTLTLGFSPKFLLITHKNALEYNPSTLTEYLTRVTDAPKVYSSDGYGNTFAWISSNDGNIPIANLYYEGSRGRRYPYYIYIKFDTTQSGVSFYTFSSNTEFGDTNDGYQYNWNGETYFYVAIG